MSRLAPLLLLAALASGCAAARARPVALDEAAREAQTPSSLEAAQLAPATFAEAEKLRRDADALAATDPTAAQILAEQAIAAYARAFAHARTARATAARDEVKVTLDAATEELARAREEQQRVGAEAQDMETRAKVLRESLPVVASGPADPAREKARVEAARSLETEARLLCVSARLLAPDTEGLKDAEDTLAALAKAFEGARVAPIDDAMRARTRCLAALATARRKSASAASKPGDALLAELSRQGSFAPVREDRGVVLTLHDAFSGADIAKSAAEKLDILGRVAAANPTLPVVVVLHDAAPPGPADRKRNDRRADEIKRLLAKHRSERVELVFAGAHRPVVDPRQTKDRKRNERVEVVFVDAGG